MDSTNELGNIPINHADDFSLIDFVNEVDFEQFIDVFREENVDPIVDFCENYDSEHIDGCFDERQFVVPNQEDLFDFDVTDIEPNYALNTFAANVRVGEEENDGEQSSATTRTNTTTTQTKKSTKADRPRTIISERRRRGRMKEKLYALRALVPNITKMDKASIIGDAVLYVQDLQMQAKKLKTEIAGLESSLTETNRHQQGCSENVNGMNFTSNHPVIKKIMQIDVLQAEERGFYVRLVCNKGLGIAVSLYDALESLSSFNVQSSNLVTADEDYVLTFTINVREWKVDMDLPNLKFWIASAFLNHGFDFETTLSA